MNKTQLINEVAKRAFARAGNPATKIRKALYYARLMDADEAGFDVVMDSVAIAASWRGRRVTVDDIAWTAPLIPVEDEAQ